MSETDTPSRPTAEERTAKIRELIEQSGVAYTEDGYHPSLDDDQCQLLTDEINAAEQAARRAALLEAAEEADRHEQGWMEKNQHTTAMGIRWLAAALRGLAKEVGK